MTLRFTWLIPARFTTRLAQGRRPGMGLRSEAVRLMRERESGVRFAEIEAIATAEYPTAAKRPANSRMNCERLKERFGWRMMDWKDSLQQVLAEL